MSQHSFDPFPIPCTPADLLTVVVEEIEDAVVIALCGEVDLYTSPLLTAALTEASSRHPPLVVVDLSATSYIGAHGIGVLFAARQHALRGGRELRLAGGQWLLQRVLAATGLTQSLEHYADRTSALRQPLVIT